MSRLSEKEIELIRAARESDVWTSGSAAPAIERARRQQSETVFDLLAQGTAEVATWTGLSALASIVDSTILRPLRRALRRRAAAIELRRLDDHMLRDIGIDRAAVEGYVEALYADDLEPRRTDGQPKSGIGRWLKRRSAIAELEALSDHQLEDIGLLRAEIPTAVDAAIAQKAEGAKKVSAVELKALTRDAVSASKPKQPRRPAPVASAAKPMPVLPLWIGPWLNYTKPRDAA